MDVWSKKYLAIFAVGAGVTVSISITTFLVYRMYRGGKWKPRTGHEVVSKLSQATLGKVHILNKDKVKGIIDQLITAGRGKIQVISDFDATLSKTTEDGSPCQTTHASIEQSPLIPSFVRDAALQLRHRYAPYEADSNLTVAEKTPIIVEWYTKSHDLLVQCGLTRDLLRKMVTQSTIKLRGGAATLLSSLHQSRVPLLLFSAGVGDVIELVLRQQARVYPNVKIVSNFIQFNGHGNIVGFHGDLIHVFNKNESAIHKSDYFQQLQERDCVLLLGDSLGDLGMCNGVEHIRVILKIGFLNSNVEGNLSKYMEGYDIVICEDQTVNVVNCILNAIA